MNVFEMEGFLRGKCLPGDMKVNETTAEYLVRKLSQAGELTAAHSTIEKAREVTNCPADVDLQDHLKLLAARYDAMTAENVTLKNVFGPGDAVLNFLTIALRHTTYDQIDLSDVSLAFQMSLPETPATDSILRAAEARGVDKLTERLQQFLNDGDFVGDEIPVIAGAIYCGKELSEQLREGNAE